jgi:signal transduction histidine kinase
MAYPDLEKARECHGAVRDIFIHHPGGWADKEALFQVEKLAWRAMTVVKDAEAQEKMGIVEHYAAALYSEDEHHKWRISSLPGADFLRLQILRALLSNAVKFTPRKGQIAVRTSNPDAGILAIEVIDTGVGIEPHQFDRMFRIFEAGDQSTRRQHGGLGLGLSISHWMAKAHGGDLTAASEGRNRGTTFTLTLPTIRE